MDIRVDNTKRINQLLHQAAELKKENEKLRADSDYIAMMADVEIPEQVEVNDGQI